MKRLRWIGLALLLVAPLWARASDGYVTADINLRAGPDVDYPRVATIPAGSRVAIRGCTEGWGWCDVIAFGHRGWMVGDYLRHDVGSRHVLLRDYGVRAGIPVVTFVIGNYWDHHYRGRPFYRQRSYWYQHPIRHRPPPRRVHRAPAPPRHGPPGYWQSPPAHRPSSPRRASTYEPSTGVRPVQGALPSQRPTLRERDSTRAPDAKAGRHGNRPSNGQKGRGRHDG
jgi:uncharacterized protein YraI